MFDNLRNPLCNLLHFFFFHPARSHEWRPQAQTRRVKGRALLRRDRIAVGVNPCRIERESYLRTQSYAKFGQIDNHQVRLGPPAHQIDTLLQEFLGECRRIGANLLTVATKLSRTCFGCGNGDGRRRGIVRPTLGARDNRGAIILYDIFYYSGRSFYRGERSYT